MSETEVSDLQLRDEIRSRGLVKLLVDKLIEGLDATEVKTCSYQGHMTWEVFTDFPTRLSYIKALNDIGQLSAADFSGSEGASGLNALERVRRLLSAATERHIAASESGGTPPA